MKFRALSRTAAALTVCMVVLFALEALFFAWVAYRPSDVSPSEAIVVFAGSSNRIRRAYELAQQGVAPVIIISPAGRRTLESYEKRYGDPGQATYILEERADTTFTNADFTARLIRDHGIDSVLLITSDYHMPRSFFLLKLATLTAGVSIGMHKLDNRPPEPTTWRTRTIRMKLAYNEMVQLWGSLAEGALYYLGGSNTWLQKRSSGMVRWLRELLLFDVSCPDCK